MKKNTITLLVCLCIIMFAACDNGTSHVHKWGEWILTKTATCTTAGEETRVCDLDASHKETRPLAIDPTAHQWGAWTQTKVPTETVDGEETKICALNPAHTETRSIPALTHVHQWGEWILTKTAACTTAGEETRVCALILKYSRCPESIHILAICAPSFTQRTQATEHREHTPDRTVA
jgi:hypothetical protein